MPPNRNLQAQPVNHVSLEAVGPVAAEPKKSGGPSPAQHSSLRQLMFRCVRLVLAGALISSAALYVRTSFTTIKSDRAYINAEFTALRTPIAGQLQLEPLQLGRRLSKGSTLFSVENPRFGNMETTSQLNWANELAERMRAESEEASARFHQQEEVFQLNEKLYAEQLISRLAFLEEQTKLTLARSAMTNKLSLAAQAEERLVEIKRQVDLQRGAVVRMPFDGVAWAIPAKNGSEVSIHETVLEVINPSRIWVDAFFHERHAEKFPVGTQVTIKTVNGRMVCHGTVESMRSGASRIPSEGAVAVSPGEFSRRIAVRIKVNADQLFDASEFFGVGRSVVVTLSDHE